MTMLPLVDVPPFAIHRNLHAYDDGTIVQSHVVETNSCLLEGRHLLVDKCRKAHAEGSTEY